MTDYQPTPEDIDTLRAIAAQLEAEGEIRSAEVLLEIIGADWAESVSNDAYSVRG